MMAGHSRWKTLQAKRLAETGDTAEHPEYEQAGRDLRLGDQLRAIRRSRNLTQKEVAERARISQPALSRIELGGGVPDIETLQRLGRAMGVRFRIIVGDENAEQEESLLVSLTSRACRRGLRRGDASRHCPVDLPAMPYPNDQDHELTVHDEVADVQVQPFPGGAATWC
jgi:transcriptional regulator with XRE-family HTH domain